MASAWVAKQKDAPKNQDLKPVQPIRPSRMQAESRAGVRSPKMREEKPEKEPVKNPEKEAEEKAEEMSEQAEQKSPKFEKKSPTEKPKLTEEKAELRAEKAEKRSPTEEKAEKRSPTEEKAEKRSPTEEKAEKRSPTEKLKITEEKPEIGAKVENLVMDGHPVPILIQNEDTGLFELDEDALEEVLLNPRVADKFVCVLAVAGAFRKGKSFLLDFLLRYMSSQQADEWLGDFNEPLKGFKWRQGSKRETTGVLIWSEPFIIKKRSGEEIAVILMDTQGTFDIQSSMKDSTTVFALTTMVASVLVYNLMNNVQEDDLMNLQLFTSYGMLAQEDCDDAHPFQRLHFLVRDWGFPYEIPYGHQGGQKLLDDILMVTEKQHPAHQEVRRDLRKCFRDINCYLMPHPGFKVIQKADFDGRLSDIEEEFVKHLKVLVPRLLAPENLVKKEIGGQPVKARDLLKFFTLFMEVFKDNDLPEPTTLVEFAAQASSQAALEAGKEFYSQTMEALVGGDRPFLKTVQMEAEHNKAKEKATQMYLEKNRYGRKNQSVVEKYQNILHEEIDKMFEKYSQQNEAKNVFKAAKTPATLFSVLMFFYLLSGIFGLFGMYSFANLCNLAMGVFLIMLAVWAYVRYSGEYRDAGVYIDELATFLWENVIHPIYQTYMEKHLKEAAEQAAQQALTNTLANGKLKAT